MDKLFHWDETKNRILQQDRGISFEQILLAIEQGGLLDVIGNPNEQQYPHQRMLVVEIAGYAYLVPFVEDEKRIYLITAFPSRKATKRYGIAKGKRNDN